MEQKIPLLEDVNSFAISWFFLSPRLLKSFIIDLQLLKFVQDGVQSKKSVQNIHGVQSNALNIVQNT